MDILAGGDSLQATAQRPLDASYKEFLRQQQGGQFNIDALLKALDLKSKENVVSVLPGSAGFLQGAAGGAGAAATSWALK